MPPALVTDEGIIANKIAGLPDPRAMKAMAVAVAAMAANEILLGKLQFRNAGEASKVARDFVAMAKDLDFDSEQESLIAAETAEDRKESLAAFRMRALENLDNG